MTCKTRKDDGMGLPTYKEIKEEMYKGTSQPVTTEDHMKYFYGALVKLVNKEKEAKDAEKN